MSKNAYLETQPALNPEITPNFRSQASQILDSLKAKAQRVSRQTAIRAAVIGTHLMVAFGILTAPYPVRAQEVPSSDVPTQPSGDQPADQPVTLEGSEQTQTSDGESPKPAEAPREWQPFAQVSYEKSNYGPEPSKVRPETQDLIFNIPYEGKELALDAHIWSNNDRKMGAYSIQVTGGPYLRKGERDSSSNIFYIFWGKYQNQWFASLIIGQQAIRVTRELSLWGQEFNTRFILKDGSTLVYTDQNGQIKEEVFQNQAGNKLDFYSASGPLTAGVQTNPFSHINAKNLTILTRDKPSN